MKSISKSLLVLMSFGLLLAACTTPPAQNATGTPETGTPGVALTPRSMNIEDVFSGQESIAPVIVQCSPAFGEELALDSSISLTFDQEMDKESVESAWRLKNNNGDTLRGSFTWKDAQKTIVFTPQSPFIAGDAYQLTLADSAQSAQSIPLDKAYEAQFFTQVPAQVAQVFPEADSVAVEPTSQITVIYNQPVVPLEIAEDQQNLPQPLVFTPPVEGSGRWVNSSVYVFQPTQALFGGTDYAVSASIPDDLVQEAQTPYTWNFETLPPSIESVTVDDNWITPPMDTESVENALHLVTAAGDEIPLRQSWNADATILSVNPKEYLLMGQYEYRLVIDEDARARNGGALGKTTRVKFQTIAVPAEGFDPEHSLLRRIAGDQFKRQPGQHRF